METNELFEDVVVRISKPYNVPLKTILNTVNFDIKIYERNSEEPFVIARYPRKAE